MVCVAQSVYRTIAYSGSYDAVFHAAKVQVPLRSHIVLAVSIVTHGRLSVYRVD